MCGRFTLATPTTDLQVAFDLGSNAFDLPARYNIAPTQPVAVIVQQGNARVLDAYRWGLIPSWAKDPKIGNRMINARAETIAEKPSFKRALQRRRCLIPADGFFEWQKQPDGKQPVFIHLANRQPFAFAGLWESWVGDGGDPLYTCTIITTAPNDLLAPVHNRMPVILPPHTYNQWLDPQVRNPTQVLPLLTTYPAEAMAWYPVSRTVNSPANDSPVCIAPLQ